MTNLKIWCLVNGMSSKEAFSVKIPSDDTVDDLKDLIKAKQAPKFDDIVASSLTLWKASISWDSPNTIKLDEPPPEDTLNPRAKLESVYPQGQGSNDCIIVQPPPSDDERQSDPGSLSDGSRPATPIQLKIVPQDHIEKELTLVLEGVNHHHITEPVDPKHVETSQREVLGSFYKRPLPYHETATDTSLVMLGLELDKQARTSDGETLHSIVEGDIGKYSDHRVVAMVAPSGSGKTATVVDLASKHFVIYCVCCIPSPTISPGFKDPNFITLAEDIDSMYRTVIHKNQGGSQDAKDIDSEVKALAGERVKLEFLARLLFLQLLLQNKPDLEPQQFFREQTTGGAATIARLVSKLQVYDKRVIRDMLRETQINLHTLLVPRRLGLVVALDEAQVAVTGILSDKLISPSALLNNKNDLFDSKNQIQSRFRRGFLTPLSATLSNMRATLVILGTALSLQDADHVYSAIAKPTNFSRITEFPQFDENDVDKILSDLVDMSDCDLPPAKRRKLTGRARFSVDVVKRLATRCSSQDSKQVDLEDAVDKSIEHTMNGLRAGVRIILESDKTGEAARLLCRMVLAYHLKDGKISFSSQQQSDFVDKALCRLRPHPDGIHLVLDEPMVVEAVQEELKASGKDPALSEYLDQLFRVVTNFGVASTSKGDALEPLVRRSLQRFNGFRLVDLPFLQGIALPKWCDDLRLQIDGINTANGFGYTDSGVAADLAFLTKCPPNKMLIASYSTRPDGAWFFSDKRYAGTLAIKFYSSPLPQKVHQSNETSSDIRRCFLQKDGTTLNPTLKTIRHKFESSGTPSNLRGILRIHLELPTVQDGMPATHVLTNPVTGDKDVMAYINLSNMDDFFFEGISEYRNEMVQLKKVIRFVCQ
ncbi:hypothetical protein B0O80DRAFT_497003 [Mortierella sp. GBAus27b]|nr:hypothetical protein B0O80DRAFT_497003 [Mortierella sp. GBAus27b]